MVLSSLLTNHFDKEQARQKPTEVGVEVVKLSPKEMAKLRKQIVETTLRKKSEIVPDSAFLGAQTQVVQEQTRAKSGSFRESKTAAGAGKSKSEQHAKNVRLDKLGVAMNFKPLGNLSPEKREAQEASTNDYIKEVKQGAQTLLNTKEFAYFTFYQRVRKQLEQFWEPNLRDRLRKMFDRGRMLAMEKEHSTRLLVVLNEGGTITRILVEDTSGVNDLDQAAIEAFNRAGPFPNPPKGMLEADGTVKVAWEFVLRT